MSDIPDQARGDTQEQAQKDIPDQDGGDIPEQAQNDIPDEARADEAGEEEPEYEDIIGDCTILVKRVVINKNISPNIGERVTIRWKRSIPEHGKTFPEEDLTFTLGDGDVEQAVELITSLMKLGEKFSVIAGFKYMYGEFGQVPDVPPKANFKFDIELLSNAGIVDYPNMDFDTRFNEAKTKKERGNILFRRRDYTQALNLYQTACKIVDRDLGFYYPDEAPEKLQEVQEFRAVILCNTSVAQVKLQLYDAAILSAREATKLCPSYSKAFYRLGQAHEKRGQTGETITAYKRALQLSEEEGKAKLSTSEVNIIHAEVQRLSEKQAKKASEKQMYSRMFGNDTKTEASENGVNGSGKSKDISEKSDDIEETSKQSSGNLHDLSKNLPVINNSTTSSSTKPARPTKESLVTPESLEQIVAGVKAAKQAIATNSNEKSVAMETTAVQQTGSNDQNPGELFKLSQQMVAHLPDLEDQMIQFKRSLTAGMKEEEAVAMATSFLTQLGVDPGTVDPAELTQMSKRIADLIPDDVRKHLEQIAEKVVEVDYVAKEKGTFSLATFSSSTSLDGTDSFKTDWYNLNKVADTDKSCKGQTTKVVACKPSARSNLNKMISHWERKIHDHIFSPKVTAARAELLRKAEGKESTYADEEIADGVAKQASETNFKERIDYFEYPLERAYQISKDPKISEHEHDDQTTEGKIGEQDNDGKGEDIDHKDGDHKGDLATSQVEVDPDKQVEEIEVLRGVVNEDAAAYPTNIDMEKGYLDHYQGVLVMETSAAFATAENDRVLRLPTTQRKLDKIQREVIEEMASAVAENIIENELGNSVDFVGGKQGLLGIFGKDAASKGTPVDFIGGKPGFLGIFGKDSASEGTPVDFVGGQPGFLGIFGKYAASEGTPVDFVGGQPGFLGIVVDDAASDFVHEEEHFLGNGLEDSEENSWLATAGYTVAGVGVIGVLAYGIYRYQKK